MNTLYCRLGLAAFFMLLQASAFCDPVVADMALPRPNSYLARSANAMPHTNPAQVDSTAVAGPRGPTRLLAPMELRYAKGIGPGHFGFTISSPYRNGRRVIWSSGADGIVKLDEASFRVIDAMPLAGVTPMTDAEAESVLGQLASLRGPARLQFAIRHAPRIYGSNMAGVYTLLDRDGNFYVGGKTGLTAYGDRHPGDPDSPIAVRRTWTLPAGVKGPLVGINMTYDGWLVLVTEDGWLMTVSRDFRFHHLMRLPHAEEEAATQNAKMAAEGRTGYGWVRNSYAVDEHGGIYIAANNWMMKMVWTGKALSAATRDGAWVVPYANSTGRGTGSTPVLMGFGKDARLVVITDGDDLMNITYYWRDAIPSDWQGRAEWGDRRIVAKLPVNLCDPARRALQSEQAVVVAGHDAFVVNNEPASYPPGFPHRYGALLLSLLGDDPAYTPHGMEKFTWDPQARQARSAWCNTEIASPNAVPFASLGSGLVYTTGVRDWQWTLEAIDIASGRAAFHYVMGGPRYNTNFSGVVIDGQGRPTFGTLFGLLRIEAVPAP
ncbi:MAG: hypothetical protein JSR19_01910 [Proteobacteria bacterium]|nr:hypothetical protein [Pseudomonadota bacterium]HQR03553.1 hypothetical protein [Rhodocyclaceae bacterium]